MRSTRMRNRRRWAHLGFALAMAFGLVSPLPAANAATVLNIMDLSKSQDDAQITRVTTPSINVRVSVTGIAPTEYQNIYYEVTNLTTGAGPVVEKNNKPQQTGENEITFFNVPLTEGKNQIVVKYGDTNAVSSAPAYVLYTPVVSITDLQIDGVPFADGGVYPVVPKQRFFITGRAPNASEVEFRLEGDPRPHFATVTNGDFFIMLEDVNLTSGSQTDFKIRPGTNRLTIIARNASHTYYATRSFVYDNGKPFAYDVKLQELSCDPLDPNNCTVLREHDLAFSPTVQSTDLRLVGKLKVDLDQSQLPTVVTKYVYGQLQASSGLSGSVTLNFVTDPSQLTPPLTGLTRRPSYISYTFSQKLSGVGPARNQTVTFVFVDGNGFSVTDGYTFFYQDPSGAYVQRVHAVLPDDSTGPELSATARNTISELPSKLRAFVNDNTVSVRAYLGQNRERELTVSAVTGSSGSKYADIAIDETIPDGAYTLTVEPYKTDPSGPIAYPDGVRTYQIDIVSVPYIIVTSLPNGKIVKNLAQEDGCGLPSTACVTGRLVNASFGAGGASLQVLLDGVSVPFTNPTSGRSFTVDLPSAQVDSLTDGRHTIVIRLSVAGRPVSEKTITFYVFRQEVPTFGDIALYPLTSGSSQPDPNAFRPGAQPGTYVTNESYVRLSGTFANAKTLTITVRTKNDKGEPRTAFHEYNVVARTDGTVSVQPGDVAENVQRFWQTINTSGDQGTFDTYHIRLQPIGDTIIELTGGNETGMATRTITITRQPLPFRILEPARIIKNAAGKDQVNINQNFLNIKLEAEGADRVVFGKDEATRDPSDPSRKTFLYEARNLKRGANPIKFTVFRGNQKVNGEFIAFYTDTNVPGAAIKMPLDASMKVFGGDVQLKFPRDTKLKRNNPADSTPLITADRQILFGIADPDDGRVDREKYSPTASTVTQGRVLLQSPVRFRPASPLYWIDAGSVKDRAPFGQSERDYAQSALVGSGRDPYDADVFYLRADSEEFVPTERGTLTLKFDPNIRDNAWRYVTVFHFDTYTDYRGVRVSGWRNIGGVVDPKNNTITVPIEEFGYYRVMYMDNSFNDVTSHPWARDALDTMFSKGLMLNKTSESFSPNEPITRGEFATLLVKIFEIPLNYEGQPTFTDVPTADPTDSSKGLWEYKYIETAARAGIVRGTAFNRFSPAAPISRQDAAVMIARAADLKLNTDDKKVLANLQKQFTDANLIDIYARPAVEAVVKKGFIEGKQNVLVPGQRKPTFYFDPLQTMTRAEAAMIALRVMKDQKKIP